MTYIHGRNKDKKAFFSLALFRMLHILAFHAYVSCLEILVHSLVLHLQPALMFNLMSYIPMLYIICTSLLYTLLIYHYL